MLVMLGCLLGTSLVVGSFSVGDSFVKSISDDARATLGPIDAFVTFDDAESWSEGTRRLAALNAPQVRAAAALAFVEAPMTAGPTAAAPDARLVEMDYVRAAQLGTSAQTGLDGQRPAPGQAWASPGLATALGLKVGDSVEVHAGRSITLKVDRITRPGVLTEFREAATGPKSNLLVAPGTISELVTGSPTPPIVEYRAVIAGPVARSADQVAPAAVTSALRRAVATRLAGLNASVVTVKADRLREAKSFGENVRFFLTVIGSFGIAAGILLLINVFVMLAEERLAELGTMRAVGLSRRPFIAVFSAEGCIYAIVGALLGGAVGLGLGRVMVGFASRAVRGDVGPDAGLNVVFSITRDSLTTGIAAGFLVSVVVVILTSVRISRMNVISAIRVLPEPTRADGRTRHGLAAGGFVVGVALTALGATLPQNEMLLLGPMVCLLCIGLLMRPRFSARTAITTAGVPLILWGGVIFTYVTNERTISPATTVLIGLALTTAGVLVANAQQSGVANVLRRPLGARSGTTARLGLAYPVARRVRTALTVAPFALVIFTLTYTEGLSHLITREFQRIMPIAGGAYQVFMESSATSPYRFADLEGASDVRHVAPTSTLIASVGRPQDKAQTLWPLTAYDERLAEVQPPPLVERPKGYATDAAVYRAVAEDPDNVIVSTNFLFTRKSNFAQGAPGNEPVFAPRIGQTFTIYDVASERAREVRIAGVFYTDVVSSGIFYGHDGAQSLFGDRLKPTSAFVATRGDARAFSSRVRARRSGERRPRHGHYRRGARRHRLCRRHREPLSQ